MLKYSGFVVLLTLRDRCHCVTGNGALPYTAGMQAQLAGFSKPGGE
jgi:hypothetical protein